MKKRKHDGMTGQMMENTEMTLEKEQHARVRNILGKEEEDLKKCQRSM